jgi:hypothetical protein
MQLPTARNSLTLTAANGRLWAVGGNGSVGGVTVEFYDPSAGATGTWYTATSLPSGRSLHAAGVMNGYLYIVGGMQSGTTTPTNTVYVYDPLDLGAGAWTPATPMPTPRHAFGGAVGIVSAGDPAVTTFIAAGGTATIAGTTQVTNTVDGGTGG